MIPLYVIFVLYYEMQKNTRKIDWNNSTYLNYPLLYIQRWIPLNAWYSSVIDGKKDAEAISSFKVETNNKLYDIIKQYLQHTKDDFYGIEFCHHLVQLDTILSSHVFPNMENRIVLGETKIRQNDKLESTYKDKGISYKLQRDADKYPKKSILLIVQDLKTNKVKHSIVVNKYDFNLLCQELEKAKVAKAEQKVIRRLFKEIEPTVTVDVKDLKDGAIKIGKVKFTSNLNYLCSAIIDVLYELRCKAVHGEIELDKTSEEIYEHAFFMLECILRKLI